jgi:hypothetical protein
MLLGILSENPFSTASVRLGHSAISAQMSGLPESGHDWAIYLEANAYRTPLAR